MSSFITRVNVNLALLKSELPAGHDFESVTYNPETHDIELRWSHREYLTKFSTHQDYPRTDLQEKKLPKGVVMRTLVIEKPVDTKPKREVRKRK